MENFDVIKELFFEKMLNDYLEKNIERFTEEEKQKVRKDLKSYLANEMVKGTITDELFDFFVNKRMINAPRRHKFLGQYIVDKYPVERYKNVMDVGAGRICRLSKFLTKHGYNVTAVDTDIRLDDGEVDFKFEKKLFLCSEYAGDKTPTDISNFDLIVGCEPCDATEHILREGLLKNKAFAVALCHAPHDSLSGTKFKSAEDWFWHLNSISDKVALIRTKEYRIAVNSDFAL